MARQAVVEVQPGEFVAGEDMLLGQDGVGVVESAGADIDVAAREPFESQAATAVAAEPARDLPGSPAMSPQL